MIAWRPCPGFPDYEVSEFGRVRRTTAARGKYAGHVLKGQPNNRNYWTFYLTSPDGRERRLLAHRLVCEAWHGPCLPDKPCVAHRDGNRQNNHFSNLRWVSYPENEADKGAHGTRIPGHRQPAAKLTSVQVLRIRKEYGRDGATLEVLGRRYGVTFQTISSVVRRKSWAALPEVPA